jgi:hypothetical protein
MAERLTPSEPLIIHIRSVIAQRSRSLAIVAADEIPKSLLSTDALSVAKSEAFAKLLEYAATAIILDAKTERDVMEAVIKVVRILVGHGITLRREFFVSHLGESVVAKYSAGFGPHELTAREVGDRSVAANVPAQVMFEALRRAFVERGVGNIRQAGFHLVGQTQENLWTYGQVVEAVVEPRGSLESSVSITSSCPRQLFDWGRGSNDVRAISDLVIKHLRRMYS